MQSFLEQYGIKKYINAHDTITLYGASRLSGNTRAAMEEISKTFVDIRELQEKLGDRIAEVTNNEAAYITNGAAGGLMLAAAVVMAGGDMSAYRTLPYSEGMKNEIVVIHSQHNCYDKALEAAGARIRLVGDADEVLGCDIAAAITEKTAALLYSPNINYDRGALPLKEAAAIAKGQGVPVIVDAAAQLPRRENLWEYALEGGDMVVFSGGKTLCGPQTSGLIVGKREYIADCRRFGAPEHGVCRGSKTSREAMLGLAVAVENYMALDCEAEKRRHSTMVDELIAAMEENPLLSPYRVEHGSVGQDYPRAFALVKAPLSPKGAAGKMREMGIFIGSDERLGTIYISPLNLSGEELYEVCKALKHLA